jgi:hypothetical protein
MLLASLPSAEAQKPSTVHARPARARPLAPRHRTRSAAHCVLVAWLVLGALTVIALPIARGDTLFGASLPFWLVAAPLIDLLWLRRRRLATALAGWRAHRRPQQRRRQARALHRRARRGVDAMARHARR